VNCLRFSPDSSKCAAVLSTGNFRIFDSENYKPIVDNHKAHSSSINSVCWWDDSTIYTVGSDNFVKSWDMEGNSAFGYKYGDQE
jgi:WD40 repeat protein